MVEREIDGASWECFPDLGSFIDNSTDDFDAPMPTPIQFDSENGTTINLTIQWDFHGLACPEFGFDTREGLFGLIDRTGTTNALIDLGPDGEIIENEGIQMILGQILAIKGGRIGFLLALLWRINPHLLFINLEESVEIEIDYVPLESLNWHPDWLATYPRTQHHYGLGIFALPYDWPGIVWKDFCSSPIAEFNRWFVEVVSSSSCSGEPFIFPLLRWFSGLLSNASPDLSQWDLGWHSEVNLATDALYIIEPDLPYDVRGKGTYDEPWKIMIGSSKESTIDLVIWLGPTVH